MILTNKPFCCADCPCFMNIKGDATAPGFNEFRCRAGGFEIEVDPSMARSLRCPDKEQKTICIPKPSHSGKFIYKTDSGEVIRFEYYQTEAEYEASKEGGAINDA